MSEVRRVWLELTWELLKTSALVTVIALLVAYSWRANGWLFTVVSLVVCVPPAVAYGWWSWRRDHRRRP